MPPTRRLGTGSGRRAPGGLGYLGRRLVAGSLAVALLSIALLVAVILVVTDADLGSASRDEEAATTGVVVETLGTTYLAAGGWHASTLHAVGDLALATGFGLRVDSGGRQLLLVAPSGPGGPARNYPIVVGGRLVGTATVSYPASGLSVTESRLRSAISTALVAASALAALVALAAAVLASRWLVAPVRSLTVAARRLGGGNLSARVGKVAAGGEIEELARAFDVMAEHLQREDTLRRALVADVAHELRTPVAVLQAELEALAVGVEELSPAAVASLGEEVRRLARLVEDLGVLAAAEEAGLTLRRERIDLAEVAAGVATRLAPRFAAAGVELVTELEPAVVLADWGRVEQMVTNVLSNAAKFTPAGGRVHLAVGQGTGEAYVSVADTGVGIPEEEQPYVFERFYRGRAARSAPGSGVGLAVVAELVAAHGGRAALESAPGEGTTVTLNFPPAA